jgi:hypothetical protein
VADIGTIPLWQFQIATAIGLLGIWMGWQGGMRRMVGFYDLPSATKSLLYGMVLGGLYQVMVSQSILRPLWIGTIPSLWLLLLVPLSISLVTMLILTRHSIRQLKGQPTSGWAFGLGLGAMLVVRITFEIFSFPEGVSWIHGFGLSSLLLGFGLALIVPWSEAIICSWQGWNALEGRRFKPAFKAMLLRIMLILLLAYGVVYPPIIFIIPVFIYGGQKLADTKWLPAGLSPRMKQEWTRLQRTGLSTGVRSVTPTKYEEE